MTNNDAATILNLINSWNDPRYPITAEERNEAIKIVISVLISDSKKCENCECKKVCEHLYNLAKFLKTE